MAFSASTGLSSTDSNTRLSFSLQSMLAWRNCSLILIRDSRWELDVHTIRVVASTIDLHRYSSSVTNQELRLPEDGGPFFLKLFEFKLLVANPMYALYILSIRGCWLRCVQMSTFPPSFPNSLLWKAKVPTLRFDFTVPKLLTKWLSFKECVESLE